MLQTAAGSALGALSCCCLLHKHHRACRGLIWQVTVPAARLQYQAQLASILCIVVPWQLSWLVPPQAA